LGHGQIWKLLLDIFFAGVVQQQKTNQNVSNVQKHFFDLKIV